MASDLIGGRRREDRGAVVVIVAAAMGALVVLTALVLDLSGARRDRDADQVAADAMALAAASGLGPQLSGVGACQAAWSYLVVNLPSAEVAPAAATSPCSAFSSACTSTTAAREVAKAVGSFVITLTHPVPDGHPLLEGRSGASLDGSACERFGVRVEQTRANLIAAGSVSLDVHATGRYLRGAGEAEAPLVLLSEKACEVLTVSGTSNLQVTTADGSPGYVAIDSDASECASDKKVVLDVDGKGSISAGQIAMWALSDGVGTSAYSSDLLSPLPTPSSARVGTSAMEWRYNCKPANSCPGPGPAHIDDLVAAWGAPGTTPDGFTRWIGSGRTCGMSGDVVVPEGKWYIDCGTAGLSVTNGTLTFRGGDIISDGPIKASSGLRVNCTSNGAVAPAACAANPLGATKLFLRSGDLLNNSSLELRETMVYLATGTVTMSGSNRVIWTAPDDPALPFDDLLLWTTNTTSVKIAGTVDMQLEGILYAPNATIELTGSSSTAGLGAQIFAAAAKLSGGAQLKLAPKEDRILKVGEGRPVLIR